jgi:F420-0:gamma-glutamyl ligase-like protein
VEDVAKRYEAEAVSTQYWKPGEDFLTKIVNAVRDRIEDGDFVTVSEKAVSTALGNIVDESKIKPSRLARFLAKYWMRLVWGYALGPLARLRKKTVWNIRRYPVKEGSVHKQVALTHAGFLQALMYGSEGGIDANNLPYSYVSLPLENAQKIAQSIREQIKSELGKNVTVMIVDTDKTNSLGRFHFTHRQKPIKGIHYFGGFLAYVIGRRFKLKRRATPIAVSGAKIGVEDALEIAEIANKMRGSGAGITVWDMAERFGVSVNGVTWEMLGEIEHKPIVIVRFKR